MAYATTADVENTLGRSLTATEDARAIGWLKDAMHVLDGYAGVPDDPDNPPGAYVRVSVNMVTRAIGSLSLTEGAESYTEQTGPFSHTLRLGSGGAAGGVWLSATDKLMLGRLRGSVTSVGLIGERYDQDDES